MQIRKRLTLGIGGLSAMIILLGILSVGYVRQLSTASGNILADNYNSLTYAKDMLTCLDSITTNTTSMDRLLASLALQEKNITEADEFSATDNLKKNIASLSDTIAPASINLIRHNLYHIMELNMASIQHKSSDVEQYASNAMWWIAVSAILCGVVAFILLVLFPRGVLKPITELKEGILEIANHNYNKRLDFRQNKEFKPVAESFNNMAEKLSEYRQSTIEDLMVTKKRIEAIVNSLHEPIIGLDPDKKILFINEQAYTILNIKSEIIGKNATEVALNNDLLRRLIRELYAADPSKEPLKIYADNKESYFQMENIPLYINHIGEKEKSFIGNVIILNNITRYKELDSAKTTFISTVSHEMKTPISSILMSLQLLEDSRLGSLNDEQKALSQSIKESSDRLLHITGELLNMTQVETGKLNLIPKITKPIELIHYAVGATRVLAERFGCFVEVEYPDEKIAKLFVDSEKVAWVVTNLLSNAIHHSPEGSQVIIGAAQHEKTIDIYVQDFGRGIDPRYHASIFERYFRVPGTKVQGSGLGLAISKDFVEAHGGTIHVDSAVGQGSRFTISLPI